VTVGERRLCQTILKPKSLTQDVATRAPTLAKTAKTGAHVMATKAVATARAMAMATEVVVVMATDRSVEIEVRTAITAAKADT